MLGCGGGGVSYESFKGLVDVLYVQKETLDRRASDFSRQPMIISAHSWWLDVWLAYSWITFDLFTFVRC